MTLSFLDFPLVAALIASSWSAGAFAALDADMIASARVAAYQRIEPDVQALAAAYQVAHPGWRLSTVDLRAPVLQIDYSVSEIEFATEYFHLGDATRIVVRAGIRTFSPDGKTIGWLGSVYDHKTGTFSRDSYRVLIDIKPNGEVVGLEINDFDNVMSYDPPAEEMTESDLHRRFGL